MRNPGRMHRQDGPEQLAEKPVAVGQGCSRLAKRLALEKFKQQPAISFHAQTAWHARDIAQTLIGRELPAQHHPTQP